MTEQPIGDTLFNQLSAIPGFDMDRYLVMKRTGEVHDMWKAIVEPIIAQHTNSIFLFNEEDKTVLHVYVDESIFAAELNARRELLKAKIELEFGEHIDRMEIHVSRGGYRHNHPFSEEEKKAESRQLSDAEREEVSHMVEGLEDEAMRRAAKKAIEADLARKPPKNDL